MTDSTQLLQPWSREQCVAHIKAQANAVMRANSAKLYPAQVEEIRDLIAEGQMTRREIGERFNVCKMTICDIATGKSWKTAA